MKNTLFSFNFCFWTISSL